MKKFTVMMLTGALMLGTLTLAGCGSSSNESTDNGAAANSTTTTDTTKPDTTENDADKVEASSDFDSSEFISVVSREDGSGTRGAFIELFGVEVKGEDGEKVDYTTEEAIITNSTDVMMTTVSGDAYAIGYCSLGSLNDSVKALNIDGATPSADTIKDGSYSVSRPFNIVTTDKTSPVAQDFINYILSADGQKVVETNGYIAVTEAEAFTSDNSEGKIVVAGSSSITPVMEKLKEAYVAVNPKAEIEIQESDSTTGVTATQDGTCDIGMVSRELKDTETGLTAVQIALDGIVVIANQENPLDDMSKDTVKSIFTGENTAWDEVIK